MHNRKNISGLNSILGVADNRSRANAFTAEESVFQDNDVLETLDVLYGEKEVMSKLFEKNLKLEHNFNTAYLNLNAKTGPEAQSADKVFVKYFKNLTGKLVITNYRLLFIPLFDMNSQKYYQTQGRFVKEFFSIPLGMVSRCERQLNLTLEQ